MTEMRRTAFPPCAALAQERVVGVAPSLLVAPELLCCLGARPHSPQAAVPQSLMHIPAGPGTLAVPHVTHAFEGHFGVLRAVHDGY